MISFVKDHITSWDKFVREHVFSRDRVCNETCIVSVIRSLKEHVTSLKGWLGNIIFSVISLL